MTDENPNKLASFQQMSTAAHGQPRGVRLVGSVPLGNAEEVFRTVSAILGNRLRRIPDGKTGERKKWIGWQYQFLANNPSLDLTPPTPHAYVPRPRFKLRSGDIRFDQLGYADSAKASYTVFSHLKQDGIIPAPCRFQVSCPHRLPLSFPLSFPRIRH